MWIRDYAREPVRVGELVFWDTMPTSTIIHQKDNSLMACLRIRGQDLYSSLDSALVLQARKLNAVFRRLTGGWGVMTDARRHMVQTYPDLTWPDPVSRLVDQERRTFFLAPGNLYDTDTVLSLVYRGPRTQQARWKTLMYTNLPEEDQAEGQYRYFEEEVARLAGLLQDCCANVTRLSDTDLLTYLHNTVSPTPHQVAVPDPAAYLDTYLTYEADLRRTWVPGSVIRWPRIGDQWVRCVGVKAYPSATQPGMLESLAQLPMEYRATTRYVPLDRTKATSELRRYRKAHYGQRKSVTAVLKERTTGEESPLMEQAALDWEQEASEAQAEVQHGTVSYGYLTQTVVVWGETFQEATEKATLVETTLNNAEFVAKVEGLNTMDAWVGSLPGNMVANVRKPLLHSQNVSHLIPATCPTAGVPWNTHLNGPPLLRTVGRGQTPFNLDTYDGDVGMAYIAGPVGCHATGTAILMADGEKKAVEDIQVGECVMGPDARPRLVESLHRGRAMMVEIRPTKGAPFIVNLDHVLSLRRTNDGSRFDGTIMNISVREWLQRSETFKGLHKLYRTGVDFPHGAALPLPPYLLGVLLGDGDLQSTPVIANPDPEIYEAVVSYAAVCGYRVGEVYSNSSGCPHYRITHPMGIRRPKMSRNPVTVILEQLQLRGCISATKFIPQQYKTGSRADRLNLLAGLLDTDGSLSRNSYDYISQSLRLAEDVCFVARSLGLAAYLTPCEKYCQTGGGGTYYRVSISGNAEIIPCRVKRKQAAPRRQKKSVLMTGFTVHPVGMGEYYGFTCESDHLYLLGDFTVTHNSGKSTALATMAMAWLQYPGAEVKIFDTGQSLRCTTYAVGGHWYDISAELERTMGLGGKLDDADTKLWGTPWTPPKERWQCFEMEDLLKTPEVMADVIRPLLHTLTERLTGAPALFVFDEGHLYLLHKVFERGIDDYIRGIRKKNGAVLFATQSIADVARSDLAAIMSDSCMTRILLPNFHALEPQTAAIYDGWGVNARERDIIAHLTPKRDYYVQSRQGCRAFELHLGPVALAFAGASQKPDLALMDTLYTGNGVQFAREWLHAKGLHTYADTLKEDV